MGSPVAGSAIFMDTQGHSIIPEQLEAAMRNGRPASVTGMKRSKISSGVSNEAIFPPVSSPPRGRPKTKTNQNRTKTLFSEGSVEG